MRPLGKGKQLENRRVEAVKLVEQQGWRAIDAARRAKVTPRMMSIWLKQYRSGGLKALRARPTPGRPLRLSNTQRNKLTRILLKGARASGFSNDLWTCPRIGRVIELQFSVRYHVDHIGRLLNALGFSAQKPSRIAIERDERQIRNWIKNKVPRIKKKPS